MKLYIANCTKQVCEFHYRINDRGKRQQTIRPGSQIQLADASLTKDEIDLIVRQQAKYGVVSAGEVSRLHGYTPRIYSVDSPIPARVIEQVIRHNTGVQVVKGRDARRMAGVQAHKAIEDHLSQVTEQTQGQVQPPELEEVDITIEQVTDPRAPFVPTDEQTAPISEGMLVSKRAEGGQAASPGKSGKRKSGGGKRKRKAGVG